MWTLKKYSKWTQVLWRIIYRGTGLRILAILPQDLGLIPSTHVAETTTSNFNSRESNAVSWPPLALGKLGVHIQTCRQNIQRHKINKFEENYYRKVRNQVNWTKKRRQSPVNERGISKRRIDCWISFVWGFCREWQKLNKFRGKSLLKLANFLGYHGLNQWRTYILYACPPNPTWMMGMLFTCYPPC